MGNHSHAHGDETLAQIVRREIVDGSVAGSAAVGVVIDDTITTAEVLARDVASTAIFDLASLSKPLTAVVIARAVAHGRLQFETRVGEVLSEARALPAGERTIGELLSHRGGLPAWGALYRSDPWGVKAPASLGPDEEPSLERILTRAASEASAKSSEVYSDIGYVLLGAIAERVMGARLPSLWFDATGIGDAASTRASVERFLERTPPTEIVAWRGTVRGEVHDENAIMIERAGGCPGHAGAFATVEQVCRFASRYLDALDGRDDMLEATLARALIAPIAGGSHALGWDLRSGPSPSSGAHFGSRTFGHLGFTGTSVWIDPDARRAVVLLTNRTFPSRDNVRIRAARPRVHDAIFTERRRTSS